MKDRGMIVKWFEFCRVEDKCSTDCPYFDNTGSARECTQKLATNVYSLLKEQEELLRKLQKDKDKLCLDVSEWKHKFYDRSLKEQEAVEPKKEDDGTPEPWTMWWYACGDCGQPIDKMDRYCRRCGQKVKWE